jgi:hypothetical protein
VSIQYGNIQNLFQFVVGIIPDIGIGSVGFNQAIAFFPDPDGMGFNT